MLLLLLAVFLIFVIFAVVAIVLIYRSGNKINYRNDIHISGGANIQTGQISDDNNYFKGVSDDLSRTTVVSSNLRNVKDVSFIFTLSNLNTMEQTKIRITDEIIIGRVGGNKVFCITSDNAVSKNHCKFYLSSGNLCLCDMNSSNHTFVNGKRIDAPVICRTGDVIKVGNTYLKVEF